MKPRELSKIIESCLGEINKKTDYKTSPFTKERNIVSSQIRALETKIKKFKYQANRNKIPACRKEIKNLRTNYIKITRKYEQHIERTIREQAKKFHMNPIYIRKIYNGFA